MLILVLASMQYTAADTVLADISNAVFEIGAGCSIMPSDPLLHHIQSHIKLRSGLKTWGRSGSIDGTTTTTTTSIQLEHGNSSTGSFTIAVAAANAQQLRVKITAFDQAGFRAALGRLARELRISTGRVAIPHRLVVNYDASDALWKLRGHQYTAAHYPSMFTTWDDFDTYTLDNAVFGTNQIELAHFDIKTPAEASDLVQYSTHVDNDGLNVSFWWSLNLFTNNKTATEQAWSQMPRISSMFFPGGDGGALVWPDIEAAATVLHKYHPDAEVWVSAQEFNASALSSFFNIIGTAAVREYLHGVVVGPHWSIPTAEIVKRMPPGYALRQYPDICHPRGAQYAIADWHWGWQATAGRQMINPMPLQHGSIVRLRSNGSTPTVGVGAYSEGVNDDLNKVIWSGLAQSPGLGLRELVAQYARWHFGADAEDAMVSALFGLEQNWIGDIGLNEHVATTLYTLQSVEKASTAAELASNWRLQMYLYRGYFDAIVQAEYRQQQANENLALEALATAPSVGSAAAIAAATAALFQPGLVDGGTSRTTSGSDPNIAQWRARLYQVRDMINASIGTEVLQGQDTSLNLDGIYHSLSDAVFLNASFANISSLSSEREKLNRISALLGWTDPGPGGYYDDIAGDAPNLYRGPGAALDPDYYQSPYTTASSKTNSSVRQSWLRHGNTFYDASMELVYAGLDRNAQYVLDIVYVGKTSSEDGGVGRGAGSSGSSPGNRLMANDEILHDYQQAPAMMQVQSFPISKATTAGGSLVIRCNQPKGLGGTGRTCEISEVWLRLL